jgi:CRP-like cAMP-binding protein
MTAEPRCQADELRTLFLFEHLSDEQLAMLCVNGHVESYEPGPICVEGEPATCFYVLIEGELTMSKLSGGQDIETNRTSQRGVYCGAWSAFTAEQHQTYTTSVHVTRPSGPVGSSTTARNCWHWASCRQGSPTS